MLLLEKRGDFWTIHVVLFVMKLTSLGIRVGGGHSNRKLRSAVVARGGDYSNFLK